MTPLRSTAAYIRSIFPALLVAFILFLLVFGCMCSSWNIVTEGVDVEQVRDGSWAESPIGEALGRHPDDFLFADQAPTPWSHGAGFDGLEGHGTVLFDPQNHLVLDTDNGGHCVGEWIRSDDGLYSRLFYIPVDWDQYKMDHPLAYKYVGRLRHEYEATPIGETP